MPKSIIDMRILQLCGAVREATTKRSPDGEGETNPSPLVLFVFVSAENHADEEQEDVKPDVDAPKHLHACYPFSSDPSDPFR